MSDEEFDNGSSHGIFVGSRDGLNDVSRDASEVGRLEGSIDCFKCGFLDGIHAGMLDGYIVSKTMA